jgi:hypothetical protein
MTMPDIKKARKLFQKAGLAFPGIPKELAVRLEEMGEWIFSTRGIDVSPYNLQHYIREGDGTHVDDYVVLSHSGHGVNSYALQYYLVHGMLEMFLHLRWGGIYIDAKKASAVIRDCFLLAAEIVLAAQTSVKLQSGARLRIVGSDFYGSYWFIPGEKAHKEDVNPKGAAEVLTEALN